MSHNPSVVLDTGDIDRFVGRYALGRERGEGSKRFLRIKVVGEELTVEQAKVIAEISERYGRGYLEITTRHSIQLHWIRDEDAPEIFAEMERVNLTTDMCGQAYPAARYGDVRNIVTCPVSGLQRGELFDVIPLVKRAVNFFTGNPDFLDLPKKFKIAISACPLNCVRPEMHDLGLIGVDSEHGLGFTAYIGGGIGTPPMLAKPMDVFISLDEALDFIIALVEVHRDHGDRSSKARARFKWLVKRLGIDEIRDLVEERIGRKLRPLDTERRELIWGDHHGVHEQKQGGLYYIVVPIITGILKVEQFRKIIELAGEYGGGRMRVSPLQKLILINIPGEELQRVEEELKRMGFDLDRPPIRWTTLACPTNFCGKALESVKSRAMEIEGHLEGVFGVRLERLNIRLAMSGCPNSCGHHRIAEIGLQATLVRKGEALKPGYDILLGGRTSKISRPYKRGVPAESVKYEVERIIRGFFGE